MDEKLNGCCFSFMYLSFSLIHTLVVLQTSSPHTNTEMAFLKLISKIKSIQKNNADMPEVTICQM